jgi:hypothetical protein
MPCFSFALNFHLIVNNLGSCIMKCAHNISPRNMVFLSRIKAINLFQANW